MEEISLLYDIEQLRAIKEVIKTVSTVEDQSWDDCCGSSPCPIIQGTGCPAHPTKRPNSSHKASNAISSRVKVLVQTLVLGKLSQIVENISHLFVPILYQSNYTDRTTRV
jgi:hypothetical protein